MNQRKNNIVCKALVPPLRIWKNFGSPLFFPHPKFEKLVPLPFAPEISESFSRANVILVLYTEITVKTLFTTI